MPQGFPLTSFEGTIEAEFGQLLQRVISKHQQCLKELDGAWRSTAILEEESHTCSRRSGQSQSGCNQSVLETLQEVGDEAVNSVQSSLAQGLQQVYDQCVRQNASLDVLSEKLERATLTMGLSALRLREHRDFRGPTGVRDADDGRSWSSSKSTATQMSLSMGLSHSIAAVTARTNPEDFKPYPVWRKRPKMSQPWVMKHRHHDQYHRAMLTKLDLLEKHSYRHQGSLIVNPNSTFRMTWEILGMLFLMYDLAVVPLLVFQPQSSTVFRVVDWIIMLFWTTDIAVSFRLAYFTKHGELKKQACAIAIHYCKRWFIFDLIVTSLDWVVVVGFGENSFLKSAKVVRGLRFLRFIRLLRIVKIGNFVSAIRLHINSQYAYMVTGIIEYLVVVVLVHCLFALVIDTIYTCIHASPTAERIGADIRSVCVGARSRYLRIFYQFDHNGYDGITLCSLYACRPILDVEEVHATACHISGPHNACDPILDDRCIEAEGFHSGRPGPHPRTFICTTALAPQERALLEAINDTPPLREHQQANRKGHQHDLLHSYPRGPPLAW